jgi:hypothetical protein
MLDDFTDLGKVWCCVSLNAPYFVIPQIILLCLMPDDFTLQRESAGTLRVNITFQWGMSLMLRCRLLITCWCLVVMMLMARALKDTGKRLKHHQVCMCYHLSYTGSIRDKSNSSFFGWQGGGAPWQHHCMLLDSPVTRMSIIFLSVSCNGNFISSYVLNVLDSFVIK